MIRHILAITVFFITQQAIAQSRSFDCGVGSKISSMKAQEMLSNVQQQYDDVRSMSGSFVQESYLASLDVSETSEGTMKFIKPGSMRWDYTAPETQEFIINNDVVYFYQPLEKQLVIDDFDRVLISDLPVAFLMGIGNLKSDFTIKGACQNQDGIVFDLLPQKKSEDRGELQELKLLVSKSNSLPIGGKVIDVSGNVTAIVIKHVDLNTGVHSKDFETSYPKGIDISDRRGSHDE